jgi:hypothetical protein
MVGGGCMSVMRKSAAIRGVQKTSSLFESGWPMASTRAARIGTGVLDDVESRFPCGARGLRRQVAPARRTAWPPDR